MMRRSCLVRMGLGVALLLAAHPLISGAATVNVRDLGAKGDGAADDTDAFQKAVDMMSAPDMAEIVVPAGRYRITRTIQMVKPQVGRDVTVRGEGKRTFLIWDGEAGGTLWESYGMGHCHFTGIHFQGWTLSPRKGQEPNRAGILVLFKSDTGRGNMINHFSDCKFTNADVGLQMGTKDGEVCNADVSFDHILFTKLNKAFLCKNSQAVDFLFNYVFALDCGTVFDLERGGNFAVNNCQLTGCRLFLNIGGGGRGAATFVCTNVRLEGNSRQRHDQLLKAKGIFWEQALVRFIGFDDVLWQWFRNETETRTQPMCEIGAGVNVSFESSAFNGPVARVDGQEGHPGSLVLRECTFGFLLPHQAISAGEYGYFRTENCFTDHMEPVPNVVKWPDLPTMKIGAHTVWTGTLPPVMPNPEKAIEANKAALKAWIEELKQAQSP